MKKKLKLKGHILDSLILSKLLDKINDLEVTCYATKVIVGRRREDTSEAIFVIEEDDKEKMDKAVEIAKKHGAAEI